MILHKEEYKHLRSAIYPSLRMLVETIAYQNESIKKYEKLWKEIEPNFNLALGKAGLTPLGTEVVCFVHSFGCEGWFNSEKGHIHVRTTKSSTSNTVETIMHETLHLITYKPDMTYKEREDKVDSYMRLARFQILLVGLW